MNTAMLDQIKKLSYAEQLQLVEEVWGNIAQEAAHQPVSEALKSELRQRLAEHRAHPETSVPWDEAMSLITVDLFKDLCFAEKLQLVEDLWDDIAKDAASQSITPELEHELNLALQEYRLNPDEGEGWDVVKVEILASLS